MGGRHATPWGLTFCLLSLTFPAHATSLADALREANRLYRADDCRGAVSHILKVLKIAPRAEIHWNLAACYLKLKDDEHAANHLREFVKSAPPGPDRQRAEQRLREIDQRLSIGFVRVTSEPPAAEVFVDDEANPAGRTPLDLKLMNGRHRIRFVLGGYLEVMRPVNLRPREKTAVHVALVAKPNPPVLAVTANEKDVRVWVSGQPAKLGEVIVRPGEHVVRVEKEGFEPWSRKILVEAGGRALVAAVLTRPKPPAPQPTPPPHVAIKQPPVARNNTTPTKRAPSPALAAAARLPAVRVTTRREVPLRRLRTAAIATAASAGAAAITGVLLYWTSMRTADRSKNASDDDRLPLRDASIAQWKGAVVALSIAGAAAVATGILFYLDYRRNRTRNMKDTFRVGLAPVPGGGIATVEFVP